MKAELLSTMACIACDRSRIELFSTPAGLMCGDCLRDFPPDPRHTIPVPYTVNGLIDRGLVSILPIRNLIDAPVLDLWRKRRRGREGGSHRHFGSESGIPHRECDQGGGYGEIGSCLILGLDYTQQPFWFSYHDEDEYAEGIRRFGPFVKDDIILNAIPVEIKTRVARYESTIHLLMGKEDWEGKFRFIVLMSTNAEVNPMVPLGPTQEKVVRIHGYCAREEFDELAKQTPESVRRKICPDRPDRRAVRESALHPWRGIFDATSLLRQEREQ